MNLRFTTRIPRPLAAWCPLILLALFSAPLLATDSDETLVEHLEAAETQLQLQNAIDAIYERTATGPLPMELTDRVIDAFASALTSMQDFDYRGPALLPRLAGEQGFSERSLAKSGTGAQRRSGAVFLCLGDHR